MAYTAIPDSQIDADSPLIADTFFKLRDNPIAIANGDSGAPRIQSAAFATGAVNAAAMGAAAVGQAALKTTTGTASIALGSTEGRNYTTAPGGQYGFWPECYTNGSSDSYIELMCAAEDGPDIGSGYVARFGAYYVAAAGTTAYFRQRYVQSSPPYDLGDGQIPLFLFALVSPSGEILGTYVAPEAPWHNNGPTDIRADRYTQDGRSFKRVPIGLAQELANGQQIYTPPRGAIRSGTFGVESFAALQLVEIEITQKLKNRDMDLLPHPFSPKDAARGTIVMLDPVSDIVQRFYELMQTGEDLSSLLHDGYIEISNTKLDRQGPLGVDIVATSWRKNGRSL